MLNTRCSMREGTNERTNKRTPRPNTLPLFYYVVWSGKNRYSHTVSIKYSEKKQSNTLKKSQQVIEMTSYSTSIHAATRLRLSMKTFFNIAVMISATASIIRVFSLAIVVCLCLKTLSFTYPQRKKSGGIKSGLRAGQEMRRSSKNSRRNSIARAPSC